VISEIVYTVAFLASSHFSVHRDFDSLQLSFFPFRSRTRPGGRFGHSVPNIHFEDTVVDLNYYNRGR
jgi:hypothetical protein